MGWFIKENPMNKWMIWGETGYFRKHPYRNRGRICRDLIGTYFFRVGGEVKTKIQSTEKSWRRCFFGLWFYEKPGKSAPVTFLRWLSFVILEKRLNLGGSKGHDLNHLAFIITLKIPIRSQLYLGLNLGFQASPEPSPPKHYTAVRHGLPWQQQIEEISPVVLPEIVWITFF